jgi:PAS domain S-box-containing protein
LAPPAPPVELVFAVELASFLVAAAGFALVLMRTDALGWRQGQSVALASGFAGVAVAAFLHGSLLVPSFTAPGVLGARIGGLALLLLGSALAWVFPGTAPGSRSRGWWSLIWVGLALQGGAIAEWALLIGTGPAGPGTRPGAAELAGPVLLGAGAVSIGVGLALASRRSVAATMAASSGGTLLALVLVLSLALSAVLSSTLRSEALRRLDSRASAEVAQIEHLTYGALPPQALLLARLVQAHLDSTPGCQPTSEACVRSYLAGAASRYLPGTVALWVNRAPGSQAPRVLARSGMGPLSGELPVLSALPPVVKAMRARRSTASLAVLSGQLMALAASPDVVRLGTAPGSPSRLVGVAVVVYPLGRAFLRQQSQLDPTVALVLVAGRGSVWSSPALVPSGVRAVARRVFASGLASHVVVGGRFWAAQPVPGSGGHPAAVLVASTTATAVDQARDQLSQTLFLIALGGTLLALLLAAVVGDRVGSRLRRLTVAAEAIRRGESGARAGLGGTDEVGVLGSAFDTMAGSIEEKESALRRAVEEEARLRDRLEAVVAGMGEALVAVDREGRVTACNQAAEELLGVSTSVAVGQPVDQVVALEDDSGASLSGRLRRPPTQRWASVGWLVPGKGERVPVAVSAGAVRGDDRHLAGGVYVLRDLRQERVAERMQVEFLSRVGHELRTPLTGIMGFVDLLGRANTGPERVQAWRQEIQEQSRRLLRTIELLEFFATAGGGEPPLRQERLEPGHLVEDVVRRWRHRLEGSHALTSRVGRHLPLVEGDRRLLGMALDELVDNAVKFSPAGGRVSVRAERGERHRTVELSVTDRGKGMSAEEAESAFASFRQGDSSDTRRYGGLGLGLALVERVTAAHGGRLAWQSRPGVGSRFTIVLPAMAAPALCLPVVANGLPGAGDTPPRGRSA